MARIDRMWVVGAPALDGEPAPGIYAFIQDGRLAFAVAPVRDGRRRVFQWTVKADGPIELHDGGDCKVAARGGGAVVLAARPVSAVARCSVSLPGEVTLSRFKMGSGRADGFIGPLARPAAALVRIGRYFGQ